MPGPVKIFALFDLRPENLTREPESTHILYPLISGFLLQ